ncbi:unnamed protein product [Schistocephalus solidus]|uniref:Uncharacterized protein n=1 Tax=Schistocephalus solidus TaxID=70667 RepID=A0A183TBS5_SCHSO|nr:unnamed protein product [Schistocephalus solidus]
MRSTRVVQGAAQHLSMCPRCQRVLRPTRGRLEADSRQLEGEPGKGGGGLEEIVPRRRQNTGRVEEGRADNPLICASVAAAWTASSCSANLAAATASTVAAADAVIAAASVEDGNDAADVFFAIVVAIVLAAIAVFVAAVSAAAAGGQ